jgi:hypothetical protein
MAIDVGYELVPWTIASDWLATSELAERHGFRQRPRKDSRINMLRGVMNNGDFRSEASGTIDFHSLGFLVNGQHRLTAQVREHLDFTWLIRRGLVDADVRVLDTGAKSRSVSDVFRMSGRQHYTRLATTIKKLYVLAGGPAADVMPVSLAERILAAHPRIEQSVVAARAIPTRIAPDTNFAAIHYLGAVFQKRELEAAEYLSLVSRGLLVSGCFPSSPGNVAIKLREFMMTRRMELITTNTRWHDDVPLRYALWGWQSYIAGGTPQRIVLPAELPKVDGWTTDVCLGGSSQTRKKKVVSARKIK